MLMLLCGTRLVGKTTFLWEIKDELADAVALPLHATFPDDNVDFLAHGQEWWQFNDKSWGKHSKEEKVATMTAMAADRGQYWVMDASGYLGGVTDLLVPVVAKYRGVKFLIPECTATTLQIFLSEVGEFDQHWLNGRLVRECTRYSVGYINHYRPMRVQGRMFNISANRESWSQVRASALEWLKEPAGNWYYE